MIPVRASGNSGLRTLVAAAIACASPAVFGHSFGRVYNLPVPFWMYAWGATGALLASFVVVAYVVTRSPAASASAAVDLTRLWAGRWRHGRVWSRALQTLAAIPLALCIATGLWGVDSPYGNFNLTAFWIVFVLGLTYVTAMTGDLYRVANPWRGLADLGAAVTSRLRRRPAAGPALRYPVWLGYWPAVVQYLAFIWLELFGQHTPRGLADCLLVYTGITLIGAWLFGSRAWFRYADVFAVFFRQIARMSPLQWTDRQDGQRLELRWPFAATADRPAESLSALVFILFMLSSTAFDGLSDTLAWRRVLWADLYNAGLKHWIGDNPLAAFPAMRQIDRWWNSAWLLASPWIYLAVYAAFVWLSGRVVRAQIAFRRLALAFAPTLLPIALAYHFTHYYTLLQTQGVKIIQLVSDPFGFGWNLFGTADWMQRTIIPDAGTVWHVQVGLIVLGHIISVYLAHCVALRLFGTRREAAISQLPMLVLMIGLTASGLWILSQPLATAG